MWIATNKKLKASTPGVKNPEAYRTVEAINAGWELIEVKSDEPFTKADVGKLRYGLIPPAVLAEEAAVMTFGAQKYTPDNWRKCDDNSRYVDAAMRHFEAWRSGEILDAESGLHHLAHVRCCLAFLMELEDGK